MEQIKIIESNIKEILDSGKELVELTEKFDNLLSNLSSGYIDLKNKKTELLNILLKYPKKKILFDFDLKEENANATRHFRIGVNECGLGLILYSYVHNLRNIQDYWAKEQFKKLFQNEEFKKLLLESIRKKHKEIILKLMIDDTKEYCKNFVVGKIKIFIESSRIEYKTLDKEQYESGISLLTNKNNTFTFEDLFSFVGLLKEKEKIIGKLSEEIKDYEKLEAELREKIAEIDGELKPYRALEQI